MNNKKTTKRALLSSVLSLVLCMAMLIGTTFAWFTDSVTSSGNIIKSGTLDVTMEWKDATATGKQTSYVDASQGAIFNYELWEPGYVEAKNVKINNIGTLALQYDLHITANGAVSELADVIDVYFAEGEITLANREMSELTKVGTLSEVLKGMPANMTGDLLADTSDTVTIALKMQEDAGNKYQGLSIGTNFSVVLMATQDNVEKDSFDENYDDIAIPEKDIKVIDGNTYYYYNDGNVALRSVPYGNVGESFAVRNDVTILGVGVDKGDTNGPVFSKSSPIKSIALNEGLKTINARAVTGIKTLTSVNFPSTLETIGEQAFAQAGMQQLTIPANVKEIKFGAFRDMAELTTVTIEGNTLLGNYVFRTCPNLTSIYLLGDDVQFVGGGQFATHADTGYANPLTIYVKNATVAARVYAAQSSASDYVVKIMGENADGSDAEEIVNVKNVSEYDAAIDSGVKTIALGSGDFVLDKGQNTELTIVGNGRSNIVLENNELPSGSGDFCFQGSNVVLENVIVTTTNKDWDGFQNAKSIMLNNCTINGNLFLSGNATFNNCTFNVKTTDNRYNVWAYSSNYGHYVAEFTNCTFNCSGKSIYVDGNANNGITVKIKGCTFNDNGDGSVVNDKAAIETGTTYGKTYEIIINESLFNGFTINPTGASTNSVIWGNKHSMTSDKLNVIIDGVDVF
jgi:predicted ribosomally synthesized peptide with SipW-like signal peptide